MLLAAAPLVLSKQDQAKLALIEARGVGSATINAVAHSEDAVAAAGFIRNLGGRVVYRDDRVDFFTAVIPIDRLNEVLTSDIILELDLDPYGPGEAVTLAVSNFEKSGGRTSSNDKTDVDVVAPPFPVGRFDIVHRDLNALEWRRENPTFDGRGVVIAHVESLPDLLLPELQFATDLDGTPHRKVIDAIINPYTLHGLDPSDDVHGWRSVALAAPRNSDDGALVIDGISSRVPEAGSFRSGVLRVPNALLSRGALDLADALSEQTVFSRDDWQHIPQHVQATEFSVLWRSADEMLWFDTDRDEDFNDETPVRPFGPSGDTIVLGLDDPLTPTRETLAMIFQVDDDRDILHFDQAGDDHATMVAGSAAGSRGDEGLIEGVAPGAQIISISNHGTTTRYAHGLIAAFADPRTDVVLIEGFGSTTGLNEFVAGRDMLTILVQRLIEAYDKPAIITANNTPGVSMIIDACVAPSVLCVGAHQSRATTLLTQGVDMGVENSLHWLGSSGPASNGAVKPDLLAPSNIITLGSAIGGTYPAPPDGLYENPPGYGVGLGTSNAAPVAAGAAALLISAAKQRGLPHGAEEITRALLSSARYITEGGVKAYQQGRGVIDVAAAWEALQQQADETPIDIEVTAPVRTAHSHLLDLPHTGIGLFEREGWTVGTRHNRDLNFTRVSGPDENMTFDVHLRGDAESFAVPSSITLPLNKAVSIEVEISVTEPGAHSALLVLTWPDRADTLAEVGLTVVAPQPLSAGNGFRYSTQASLRPAERRSTFVRLPKTVDALWQRTPYAAPKGATRCPGRVPYTMIIAPSNLWEVFYSSRKHASPAPFELAVSPAIDGVWESTTHDRSPTRKYDGCKSLSNASGWLDWFDIDIAALDVDVRPSGRAVQIDNKGAEFVGGLVTSSRASSRQARIRFVSGMHRTFEIDIDPDAEMLVVEIGPDADAEIDADLYLFYCRAEGLCEQQERSYSYGMVERVLVKQPTGGVWKAVVATYSANAQAAPLVYRDYWTHPQFGGLASSDAAAFRDLGATWSALVTPVAAIVRPQPGRTLADVFYVSISHYVSAHADKPSVEARFVPAETFVPLGLTVRDSDLR